MGYYIHIPLYFLPSPPSCHSHDAYNFQKYIIIIYETQKPSKPTFIMALVSVRILAKA